MRNLGSPKGVKAELSEARKNELSQILGVKSWKRIRSALMIQHGFRCVVCRERKGASFLTVRHLTRPTGERSNEIGGWKVLCFRCLD